MDRQVDTIFSHNFLRNFARPCRKASNDEQLNLLCYLKVLFENFESSGEHSDGRALLQQSHNIWWGRDPRQDILCTDEDRQLLHGLQQHIVRRSKGDAHHQHLLLR